MTRSDCSTWRRCVVAGVLLVIALGCSATARQRLMHFFFEIPEQQQGAPSEQSEETRTFEGHLAAGRRRDLPRSQHAAVLQKQCQECHAADKQFQVNEEMMMTSCADCHQRYFGETVGHDPATEGECLACHVMHRSMQSHLLARPVLELCVDCHDEPEDLSEDNHAGAGVEQCTKCHDPHFGEGMFLRDGWPRSTTGG